MSVTRAARAALACALAALCGCLPDATVDDLQFACDAGASCEPGFRCWRGVCTQDAGWSLGTPCVADDDCAGRVCSRGVCCSRRCDGACERCDQGPPGRCDPLPTGSAGSPACAPYFCNGTSGNCPGNCTTDPDCAAGNYCDAGTCSLLQVLGDRCVRGGTCASNTCVDGRCCNNPCGSACDACDVPGFLGQCRTAPLGRLGNPSCAPYACNGSSITCPTSCTSDAGCVPGLSCSFFQRCQPKVDALYEPFNGTVLDAGTWSTYAGNPGVRLAVNNRLELTVDPWAADYVGIYSNQTYDGTNARLSAQLVVPGDLSIGSYDTYFEYLATDNLQRFGFDIYNGAVHFQEQRDGTYYQPAPPVTYNPSLHRFFRLRVDGGVAVWEISADAGSFTVMGSIPTKPWMQTLYVELGSGAWNPEDAGTTSAWDNVRR